MAGIEDRNNPNSRLAVESTLGSAAVSQRPMQAAGYYRWAGVSGLVTGVVASGELFQLRWTDPNYLALIQFLRVRTTVVTAFTAAQELINEVVLATGFTGAGTGGTQILANGANLMKRSNFPQSKVQELRIATTAALGAGTKSLNTHSIGAMHGWAGAQGQTPIDLVMDMTNSADMPIVLLQNEGLIIRNGATAMGAAGVVKVSVEIAWAEKLVAEYPVFT